MPLGVCAEVLPRGGEWRPCSIEVYVVGDTPRDIEAAHAAEATAVGVASGPYTVEELRAAGADHVLASLAEPFPGI